MLVMIWEFFFFCCFLMLLLLFSPRPLTKSVRTIIFVKAYFILCNRKMNDMHTGPVAYTLRCAVVQINALRHPFSYVISSARDKKNEFQRVTLFEKCISLLLSNGFVFSNDSKQCTLLQYSSSNYSTGSILELFEGSK
jgi:hypothetical protein